MTIQGLEYAAPLIFFAAVVRAYTGFGFAAIAIIGLNLIWPPQISVPVVLLIDLLCSLSLIPKAWQQVERPHLQQMTLGALFGVPLGLLVLIELPALTLKLATSLIVLLMVVRLLWPNQRPQQAVSAWGNRCAGAVSAAITAAASVGGLPLVAYLLNKAMTPVKQRALMVIFLSASTLISLTLMLFAGVLTLELLYPVALLLLPALLGIYLGQRLFFWKTPVSYKPVIVPLLTLLAVSSLILNIRQI